MKISLYKPFQCRFSQFFGRRLGDFGRISFGLVLSFSTMLGLSKMPGNIVSLQLSSENGPLKVDDPRFSYVFNGFRYCNLLRKINEFPGSPTLRGPFSELSWSQTMFLGILESPNIVLNDKTSPKEILPK